MRIVALALMLIGGCLTGCTVHGRYLVTTPFGNYSWGAESETGHKADVAPKVMDYLFGETCAEGCECICPATPTGSMAVPNP